MIDNVEKAREQFYASNNEIPGVSPMKHEAFPNETTQTQTFWECAKNAQKTQLNSLTKFFSKVGTAFA